MSEGLAHNERMNQSSENFRNLCAEDPYYTNVRKQIHGKAIQAFIKEDAEQDQQDENYETEL